MDRRSLIVAGAIGLGAAGCAPRVPVPPEGSHEGDLPVVVPFPPPAARSEVIPDQPHERAVWVDGYWTWKTGAYSWSAGRWVRPNGTMVYARAMLVRLRSGELLFYPPKWQKLAGAAASE